MSTVIPLILAMAPVLIPGHSNEGDLRLNEMQVIGSHNSYHIVPSPTVYELIASSGRSRAEAIDYTHPPLAQQFGDQGIRQIELDIFADPDGGKFAKPAARKMLSALGKDPGPDPNADGALDKPGLKVLHFPDFDYRSTTPTFLQALKEVHAWSKAHPSHVPILVLVELKDESAPTSPTKLAPFDAKELDGIDQAIRSVFTPRDLLTPDDVRGEFASLPEAIKQRGWPKLAEARGKVLFALDNEGTIRDRYLDGHPALRGRVLFATAPNFDHPAAAWFKINDAIGDFEKIQEAVKRGFLVRTRADTDTIDARKNNPTRRDKALTSGAQFISTDFRKPRPDFSTYHVALPGDVVARPNPVNRSKDPIVDLELPVQQKP